MEETLTNQPVQIPVPAPDVPVTPPVRKWNKIYLGAGAVAVLVLTLIIYVMGSKNANTNEPVQVATTPTPLAKATPVQQVSAIATSSAFMLFTENVASLSATVNAFTLQDGSFTPPALDLDIGFSTQ